MLSSISSAKLLSVRQLRLRGTIDFSIAFHLQTADPLHTKYIHVKTTLIVSSGTLKAISWLPVWFHSGVFSDSN